MLISPPNFDAASMNKKLILTSIAFPFGIDPVSDPEVQKALVSQKLVVNITPGIKGVSDTLSFSLNPHLLQVAPEIPEENSTPETTTKAEYLNKNLYLVSPFQSSNYMLGVICEVIFLFKKSNLNLAPLMNALKSTYFAKLPKEAGF